MADYFTHFSCLFDVGTPENAAQALALAATPVEGDEDDAAPSDGFAVSIDEPGSSRLWNRDDGSGDPERVIGFARRGTFVVYANAWRLRAALGQGETR